MINGSPTNLDTLHAGYAYDAAHDLYYCSARYYDASTRQFISRDPAKADGAQSAYQYCAGNPVLAADPGGERLDSGDGYSQRINTKGKRVVWDVWGKARRTSYRKAQRAYYRSPIFYFRAAVSAAASRARNNRVASVAEDKTDLGDTKKTITMGGLTEAFKGVPTGFRPPMTRAEAGVWFDPRDWRDSRDEAWSWWEAEHPWILRAMTTALIVGPGRGGGAKGGGPRGTGGTRFADPKFAGQLERQLAKDGPGSVQKSLRTLERRLAIHKEKLSSSKYTSSIEREIRTFDRQIATVKQFMKDRGIQ